MTSIHIILCLAARIRSRVSLPEVRYPHHRPTPLLKSQHNLVPGDVGDPWGKALTLPNPQLIMDSLGSRVPSPPHSCPRSALTIGGCVQLAGVLRGNIPK